MTSEAFWNDYSRLVARIMPPLAPGDGLPEAEIAAAEARLGLRLPTILREFYALVGRRKDINTVHNRLVSLEELEVDQDRLVFYEENQAVFLWGVSIRDPEDANPAVFMAENQQELAWEFDHDHLSEFLRAMVFWQAVNGGMAYSGIGTATSDDLEAISDNWEVVDLGGDSTLWGNRVRMRDGQVLFVVGNDPDPQVFGGGCTRDDFLAVEEAFGVSWDYSTLDEEPDEDDEESEEAGG